MLSCLLGAPARNPIKLGALPQVGDSVFVIGHPLASPADVITAGKVTAVNATLDVKDPGTGQTQHYTDLIKSTVPVYPGNSGGPEFNKNGEAIGVKVVANGRGSVSIPIASVIEKVKKTEGKV